MSLVLFVTGSNRHPSANRLPCAKVYPPISTADTNVIMAAMVDVFMYFCARNGLTMTKHLSHEITEDRNCDIHADPATAENKTKVTLTKATIATAVHIKVTVLIIYYVWLDPTSCALTKAYTKSA